MLFHCHSRFTIADGKTYNKKKCITGLRLYGLFKKTLPIFTDGERLLHLLKNLKIKYYENLTLSFKKSPKIGF